MRSRRVTSWGLAAAALLLAVPVQAQYETTPDGRLLDNSLRIGSGGYNEPAATPDYFARNALITKNTPGLTYFRGNVPYAGQGELMLRLPSDHLYNFRAQSAPMPINSLNMPYNLGQGQVISRGGLAPGRYDPSLPVAVPGLAQQEWDGTYRYQDVQSMTSPVPVAGRVSSDQLLGTAVGQDGRLLQITASPLLGVRQREVEELERLRQSFTPEGQPPPRLGDSFGVQDQLGVTTEEQPSASLEPVWANRYQLSGQLAQPLLGVITGTTPVSQAAISGPTSELGLALRMQGAVEGGRLGEQAVTLDQRVQRIAAMMFSPLGSASAGMGDDVYMDLLRKIKTARDTAHGREEPLPPGGADRLVDQGQQRAGAQAMADVAATAPTPEQLAAAAQERQRAAQVARGLTEGRTPAGGTTGLPGAGQSAQSTPEAAPPAQPAGRLAELMETINYRLPSVTTLAGERDTHVNQMMRQAEAQMAQGLYFDAESTYKAVLVANPRHTMARVGLIHASMGAGLIQSAALELRRLFDEHPEMIAARYEARLLPAPKRMLWIRQELDKMINTTSRPEPPLMLAYVGYQLGQQSFIEYGLDLAEARSPRDPLLSVLRTIWLERPGPAPGASVPGASVPGAASEAPAGQ